MNQREYHTIILAGLLHDVGKLLNKPDPKGKKHAVYSVELLQEPRYADAIQSRFADYVDFDLLCYLVLRHDPYLDRDRDLPEDYDGPWDLPGRDSMLRCIRLADALSAGERSLNKVYGQQARGTRALDSIFAPLELGRHPGVLDQKYAPAPITPHRAFPADEVEPLTQEHYQPLQGGFRAALAYALEHAAGWSELQAWIYSLLERYTWCVPSAVHLEPRDVSLFDHARTSCALAAAYALRRYGGLHAINPTFLFIKGDVSGVQDYIYSVANVGPGGVAKRLRARSFFVTALTEVVAHRLRQELVPGYELPIAAQIFAGGGQFVLLAPNLREVHDQLESIEHEVNDWLWNEFQGDLAMVFGHTPAGQKDLSIKPGQKRTICDVLDRLDRQVKAAKAQRLGTLLQRDGAWAPDAFVWAPQDKNYEHGACPSCGRLPAQANEEEENIDLRLCQRCRKDRLLSERIVDAQYIAYFKGPKPGLPGAGDTEWLSSRTLTLFNRPNEQDGWHVVLLRDTQDVESLAPPPYQMDGFGYREPTAQGPALVRHFANHVPRWESLDHLKQFCTPGRACVQVSYDDHERCGILVRPDPQQSKVQPEDFPILRTFGCISAAAAEWPAEGDNEAFYGTQLLGILRADVDNLGKLFTQGIGQVKSLSRLATLSRMTDLFFSGWVNETLEHPPDDERYDLIYTVYSGGDDLCLVGPWDVIVDFARYMASEFERYVTRNPNVTLSAAISVTKPKFPIATSARQAGSLLKTAKDAGRNRFNLFGVTTRWSKEPDQWVDLHQDLRKRLDQQRKHATLLLDELWTWAELLDRELRHWREARSEGKRYSVSTGFAHRLLGYAEMARRWEQEQQITTEDMLYLARLAYDLGRNVSDSDAVPQETKQRLTGLTQLANRKVMAGMRLPITYALHRNRERSKTR